MKGNTDREVAEEGPTAEAETTKVTHGGISVSAAGELRGALRFAAPVLLMLYLCFAGLHAAMVPTGQTGYQNAPDEAAHLAYVRSIAAMHLPTHSQPTPFPGPTGTNGYEWHQPPLYYAVAAPFLIFGEHGVRLCSILLGLVGLLLIYRGVRLLFPADPYVALPALGLAALTPTHIAITSTVNNDVLLEVFFSATLVLLIGAMQAGLSRRSALLIGMTIGGAILTKATGLLLLPVFGFAIFLLYRSEGSLYRSEGSQKDLLRNGAVTLVTALLVSGWWFARNQALYGQLLPLRLFAADFGHTAQAAPMVDALGGWSGYFLQAGLWTFCSFWAVYGTAHDAAKGIPRFLPEQVYLLLGIAGLCAGIGLARVHFQRKALFNTAQLQGIQLCFLTIFLVGMAYIAFITKYFQMQGRYLFPAMFPIVAVFTLGFRGLLPERWKNPASILLLVLLGVICLAFLQAVSMGTVSVARTSVLGT